MDPISSEYERYAVVAFADVETSGVVERIRTSIPPRVAVMPAHVTVKGSFTDPVSLTQVWQRIEDTALITPRLSVPCENVRLSDTHLTVRMGTTPPLQELHDRLFDRLADLINDVYGDRRGDGYSPHMTVLYWIDAAERETARGFVPELERLRPVRLDSVSLTGRVGDAESGEWVTIRTAQLAAGASTD